MTIITHRLAIRNMTLMTLILVHVIQEDVNWTGKAGIVIPRSPQRADSPSTSGASLGDMGTKRKAKQKADIVKGQKRKSCMSAREDKVLVKKLVLGGNNIKRNERQEKELQQFNEGNGVLMIFTVCLICFLLINVMACHSRSSRDIWQFTMLCKVSDCNFIFISYLELAKLNGSIALSEIEIKCGICLKRYSSRNTERSIQGKINYFRLSKL